MPVPGSEMNIKYKWVIKFHCSNRKQAQGKTNKQTNKKKTATKKTKQNKTTLWIFRGQFQFISKPWLWMSTLSKSREWEYHFFQKCFKWFRHNILFLKQVSAEKRRLIKKIIGMSLKSKEWKNVYILFYLFFSRWGVTCLQLAQRTDYKTDSLAKHWQTWKFQFLI